MRSKPKRAIIVIIITMAAFIFSVVLAFIIHNIQSQPEKMRAIFAALKGKEL